MINDDDIVTVNLFIDSHDKERAILGKGKVVVIERNLFIELLRKAFPTMIIEDEYEVSQG